MTIVIIMMIMKQKKKKNLNDVEEGKTLFITNIPPETTDDEIRNYIINNINKDYIYIKTCQSNNKNLSVFVKLKYKQDADTFLKKIGEYEYDENNDENDNTNNDENNNDNSISDDEENIIDKFYKNKKNKKEKMKKILLKENKNKHNINSEILFFKNTYLMIKRAVNRDLIKEKRKNYIKSTDQENENNLKKKTKQNNIHLINDNNVNNENLSENIIKRNNNLMEKKKELLKNKNFFINPCRIYIRNYPAVLEQNTFRQLITKYFTPIIMKKYNMKKKEAFKKASQIIKKIKIIKDTDTTNSKDLNLSKEKSSKLKNKNIILNTNSNNNNVASKNVKNYICFVDINKHENAKKMIQLLQNKNIYELINEIIYKKKFQTIKKNKNIIYVDYCIEDIRMIHIKKIKEEKFLNHVKQQNLDKNINNKIIDKKKKNKKKNKVSRGKRQREKKRLLKMKNECTNILNVINNATLTKQIINQENNTKNEITDKKDKDKHTKLKKLNKTNKSIDEKKENKTKKNVINKKKLDKQKEAKAKKKTKKDDVKLIRKDVLNFLNKINK
ncbi:hypothetical protein PFMALIP_04904 [Plasmodium falciparum MaliPS096_E11]|uniref:RRM domain-containing protein n=1 Tax=Plasmodium falciparum MaliPS096_E11 TaxID=1036727 RepID=A0A024WI84_PLAFA|nr:hypothetical protein PFMALIP_04904 [Plasmodium falciparum MaliPS096_E11]